MLLDLIPINCRFPVILLYKIMALENTNTLKNWSITDNQKQNS